MERIDTKELRELSVIVDEYCSHFEAQKIDKAADELDRLYLDHAPLSREELEGVLKEGGWEVDEDCSDYWYRNGDEFAFDEHVAGEMIEYGECRMEVNDKEYSLPLSAVTRATLAICGVIK